MNRFFTILLLLPFLVACMGENRPESSHKDLTESNSEQEVTFQLKNDSLSRAFLSKVSYDKALLHNNLPLYKKSYKLNEITPAFKSIGLKNIFDSIELKQPIPIREVKWEFSKDSFVTVWYTNKKSRSRSDRLQIAASCSLVIKDPTIIRI